MPEVEIREDGTRMTGKRRQGRDETLDDAMKTMERFSDWLAAAQDNSIWLRSDPLQVAMVYGMFLHLRDEIDRVMAAGGNEARETYEFFANHNQPGEGGG
jgi:hypothetical protein